LRAHVTLTGTKAGAWTTKFHAVLAFFLLNDS
jgi:hypothetical protein